MSACCVVGFQFVGKITSRQPTVSWLCENIANAKCADFGHSAAQIADRTRSNANLDWTCPTCLHIKIDIRALMRQTELEFQAFHAGFTDLWSRFNVCDSNFKGRVLLSQSSVMSLYMFLISRPTSLFPAPLQTMCRLMRMIPMGTSHQDMTPRGNRYQIRGLYFRLSH